MNNVHTVSFTKPKTFTSSEAIIELLSQKIFASKHTYKDIAKECNVSNSTIANVASRKTRWPRPTTFFALLVYFNMTITITE